jgi:hypothetical protein
MPVVCVNAPKVFEALLGFFHNFLSKCSKKLCELMLDHLDVYRIFHQIRVEEGILGLKELTVYTLLTQDGVRLLEQPLCLGAGKNDLVAIDEVRENIWSVVLGVLVSSEVSKSGIVEKGERLLTNLIVPFIKKTLEIKEAGQICTSPGYRSGISAHSCPR